MQTPDAPASVPRKFILETVFEGDAVVRTGLRPKRSYTPDEVEIIRAECFAEGERSAVRE